MTREFPDKAAAVDLGDPADDAPLTLRVHPDDDPHDPNARRRVKTGDADGVAWLRLTGTPCEVLYASDHEVADWPGTSMVVAAAAFAPVDAHRTFTFNGDDGATCTCGERARDILTRTGAGIWHATHRKAAPVALVGDMGAEAFKGVRTP